MKDSDYTFGETTVYCDGKGCKHEEMFEGFDGRPPSYSDVNSDLREIGWKIIRKLNGDWIDLCPSCQD